MPYKINPFTNKPDYYESGGGGGGSVGDTQIAFGSGGTLVGDANLTYDGFCFL